MASPQLITDKRLSGNAIPLQEINGNSTFCPEPFSLSASSSEEDIQFSKKQHANRNNSSGQVYPVEELPPLSGHVTISDFLFNFAVLMVIGLNICVDLTLVVYHYNELDYWASAITCLCLCAGGLALLGQFWGVTYNQLERIYSNSQCVRCWINSLPWLATLIT